MRWPFKLFVLMSCCLVWRCFSLQFNAGTSKVSSLLFLLVSGQLFLVVKSRLFNREALWTDSTFGVGQQSQLTNFVDWLAEHLLPWFCVLFLVKGFSKKKTYLIPDTKLFAASTINLDVLWFVVVRPSQKEVCSCQVIRYPTVQLTTKDLQVAISSES